MCHFDINFHINFSIALQGVLRHLDLNEHTSLYEYYFARMI